MKFKPCMQGIQFSNQASAALLLLRLVVGIAFLYHGWGKIQNPFAWAGPDSTIPAIFLGLAALAEFGGGLALIVGLLTRLAMLGLACTMAVAIHMHMIIRGDPFVNPLGGPSYELASVFFAVAVTFMVIGPGKFSLDDKIFGTRKA